ncbi:DUF6461 domain-containing protein [Streptosporangium soli]|nr:DUF6461 domain-containing protein [Streptosporangium sp. KLBMP 9127]
MTDPLAPFRWLEAASGDQDDLLGDIFCVSFFRGLDPGEVLGRFGPGEPPGREMTFDRLGAEANEFVQETGGGKGGGYVGVVQTGGWSVAVELWGWEATLVTTVTGLSQGCEVVAAGRHDYAEHGFVYAIDGEIVTGFTPELPEHRWGGDPDRLNALMRETGLSPETSDDEAEWNDRYENGIARMFALAAKITGVPFTPGVLDGPLLVGAITR